MFNFKVLGVGTTAAAATTTALVMRYHAYVQKREKRALEEMNQIFSKDKNDRTSKDKLVQMLLWQEEKIKAMEEQMKSRENRQVTAALEEGMTEERSKWEQEILRKIRAIEALSEKWAEERLQLVRERESLAGKWEQERRQLVREKDILAEKCDQERPQLVREKDILPDESEERLHLIRENEALMDKDEQERLELVSNRDVLADKREETVTDVLSDEQKETLTDVLTDKREETLELVSERDVLADKQKETLELVSKGDILADEQEETLELVSEKDKRDREEGPQTIQENDALADLIPPEQMTAVKVPEEDGKLSYVCCELTLDPNTANRNLSLSENCKKATCVGECQSYSHHPGRFGSEQQVLCREGLTGCCYWEVDWSGWVYIAVTYRGINKSGQEGDDFRVGHNDKSWSLECYEGVHWNRYYVHHDGKMAVFTVGPSHSNRIGVDLDWAAGTLSFYRVCYNTRPHLYTFRSTFTEPLYPGFGCWLTDSSVALTSPTTEAARSASPVQAAQSLIVAGLRLLFPEKDERSADLHSRAVAALPTYPMARSRIGSDGATEPDKDSKQAGGRREGKSFKFSRLRGWFSKSSPTGSQPFKRRGLYYNILMLPKTAWSAKQDRNDKKKMKHKGVKWAKL